MILTILLTLISFISIMFMLINSPMPLGLLIILQTIMLSIFLMLKMKSFWYLYLLMLIFIGGMLILFIYTTSILPNTKFFFNQNLMILLLFMLFILFLFFLIIQQNFHLNISLMDFKFSFLTSENMLTYSSSKIFNTSTNMMIIFLVNYLFYCMIIVVKMTNNFMGPIRKMF